MYDKNNPPRQPEHGTIALPSSTAKQVNKTFGLIGKRTYACGGCVTRMCDSTERCDLPTVDIRQSNGVPTREQLVWVNEELYTKWKLLGEPDCV